MSDINIFEQAVTSRLRFRVNGSLLTVEDVSLLPLQSQAGRLNLDDIAKELNNKLKNTEVSFVTPKSPADTADQAEDQLRFDIVKRLIEIRLTQAKAAADKQAKAHQRAKIMEIMARKQDAALEGKDIAELEAMLASL